MYKKKIQKKSDSRVIRQKKKERKRKHDTHDRLRKRFDGEDRMEIASPLNFLFVQSVMK